MEKEKINDIGRELVITIDLPGVKTEDLTVKYGEDYVEVSAEKRSEFKRENDIYFSHKVLKRIYRKIPLPVKIVPEKSNYNIIEDTLQIITPKKRIK
jgi:HSP20 family protein